MVKLLKSGRVPEERQGTVIEMIGKRGSVADLDYIYQRVLDADCPPSIRAKALDALAEAASTRGLKPEKDRETARRVSLRLRPMPAGSPLREPAVRLAGAWKLEAACGTLREIARSAGVDREGRASRRSTPWRRSAGQAGRSAIEDLAGPGSPTPVRLSAVAALTRLDADAAAARAAELIPIAAAEGADLKPMMAAFLNRQGGGAILARAIGRRPIPADAAKLALRAVYSLSQADPALVAALGKAAGISTEVKPLTPARAVRAGRRGRAPRATRLAARPSSGARTSTA